MSVRDGAKEYSTQQLQFLFICIHYLLNWKVELVVAYTSSFRKCVLFNLFKLLLICL